MPKKNFFLILTAVILFAFWPCLSAGFLQWDDVPYVLNNPLLPFRSFADILRVFTYVDASNGIYVPVTVLSFGLERAIWGINPFIAHLNNILLHIISAGLVLLLGRRLGLSEKAALVGALVFALHPMRVESVAWVIERKDVLFGAFYLGSLVLYLEYLRSGKGGMYIGALVCGVLSVLSKPMALSLPFVLFLMDWMSRRNWNMKAVWDKIPFVLAMWPLAMISSALISGSILWKCGESFLIAVYAGVFYVAEFFCPRGLQLIVLTPRPVVWDNPVYMGALAGVLILAAMVWFFRKKRWVVFAGIFYALTIFVVLRVAQYSGPIVAERYTYIPSVGFCLLVGAVWDQLFFRENVNSRRRIYGGWLIAAILSAALAAATFQRCLAWQDSLTLWNEVLRGNPRDANAYINRGVTFVNDPDVRRKYGLGRVESYALAHRDFLRAVRLAPTDEDAWHNLSVTFRFFGKKAEADKAAHRAKRLGWHAP